MSDGNDADVPADAVSPDGLADALADGPADGPNTADAAIDAEAIDGGDASTVDASSPDAGVTSCSHRIAFHSDRPTFDDGAGGDGDIYRINADGTGELNLTANPVYSEADPRWSPDGKLISYQDVSDGIRVMYPNGTGNHQLTGYGFDDAVQWSPDGAAIAFGRVVQTNDIMVLGVYTDELLNLTQGSPEQWSDLPSWSPDGSHIAYIHREGQGDDFEIYVISADGQNKVNLTNNNVDDGAFDATPPQWSPDGSKVLYVSRVGAHTNIWVVDADGQNAHNLTNSPHNEGQPRWINGESIAFVRGPKYASSIWRMNADGTGQQNLTGDSAVDKDPVPSPDGMRIVWTRCTADDCTLDLYFHLAVMNADGTNQIFFPPGDPFWSDDQPVWEPCP